MTNDKLPGNIITKAGLAACAAVALIWAQGGASAAAQRSARAMFYDTREAEFDGARSPEMGIRPIPPASRARYIGVHYWIETPNREPAADTTIFSTGDRIRLHVRSNASAFLAVWAVDEHRRVSLLLPVGGDITGSGIQAGADYSSPSIAFTPPVQDERLILCLAREKGQMPAVSAVERGIGALLSADDARSLKVDTEERIAGQVGTYVVNERGGPIAHEVVLRHRARSGAASSGQRRPHDR